MLGVVGAVPSEARAMVERTTGPLGIPVWHLGEEIQVRDRTLSPRGQSFGVHLPGQEWSDLRIPLLGRFQPGNAALAVAAAQRFAERQGFALEMEPTRRALAHVHWPARLERKGQAPDLFYDVAHTPESARAVAQSLAEISPMADPSSSAVVFGCLRGKDVPSILDAFAPLARTLVVVPVRSERGFDPAELRTFAAGRFPRVVVARSAEEGLRLGRAATGPDGLTLVVGSDYLIGELLRGPNAPDDEPDLSDPGVGDRPTDPGGVSPVPGRAPPQPRT
jgi:dihydrofolate synthase / folylpolyglutamate synthase